MTIRGLLFRPWELEGWTVNVLVYYYMNTKQTSEQCTARLQVITQAFPTANVRYWHTYIINGYVDAHGCINIYLVIRLKRFANSAMCECVQSFGLKLLVYTYTWKLYNQRDITEVLSYAFGM